MADKQLAYQDAVVTLTYGFSGLHAVSVKCRKLNEIFGGTEDELTRLAALLYSGINTEASKLDPPSGAPEPVIPLAEDPHSS